MRIFKNVFTTLAVSMIGFGILIGVMFPFFTLWMGVSKDITMSVLFFVLCILAGIVVGAVNIALARGIVRKRLTRLSGSMIKVEQKLSEIARDDFEQMCASDDCFVSVDSNDVFGKSAHAFNQLLKAFEQSLRTQNAVRTYNRTLTSELQVDVLTSSALREILAYTGSAAGAIYVVETGELSLAACEGIKDAESLVENNRILDMLKSHTPSQIDLPDGVIIDGLLTDIKPRSVIIEPIVYKDTAFGVIVLASTHEFAEETCSHLDMFSGNLALALNNALKHSQLQTLVALDPLTGVYNRRFGFTRLTEEYSAAIRSGAPLGLLMFDLDHFKTVNDTYGHIAGDKVLVGITQMAKAVLRKYDILIRYGGEEFVAVLPGASTQDTLVVADRLRALIEQTAVQYGEHQMHVTVSIGVVSYPDTELTDIKSLISFADEALYRAKEGGRNQVVVHDKEVLPNG